MIAALCAARSAAGLATTAAAAPRSAVRGARAVSTRGRPLLAAAASEESGQAAAPAPRKRVLSGVQPTGTVHLGNYLGAIRQWVDLQEEYETYFCVVDLHATTMPHVPKELTEATYRTAALYLACGIDPTKSQVFVQSHVRAHAELTWLFNCMTPIGWLEKMIQYKEKAVKQGESVAVGLFDYPVLMAADILLYQASLVPVGEDQRQHLELTRDISRRFHDLYCKKRRRVFREPEALIMKESARIMSLQDGTAKMSKSAESDLSRIELLDTPDVIARKIKKCKTDAIRGLTYGDPDRPEATNLINIYGAVTGEPVDKVVADLEGLGWGDFKPRLTEAIVEHLAPIQKRYAELAADPEYLRTVLADGAGAASALADATLEQAKDAMGYTLPGALPKLTVPQAPKKKQPKQQKKTKETETAGATQ